MDYIGGVSIFVLILHVHECLHIIRNGMHFASKFCTCVCLVLSQVKMLGAQYFVL